MYVDDLKNEFFGFLAGKRIFLMIHYDIDSICCCKILQSLLRHNHILYSLAVVRGIEDFKTAFRENCEDVKYFVLINCGGTIDIVEVLEPEEDIIFFVLDSHRPIDLCNIYSNEQVRLLSAPEEDAEVPGFDSIFREESDEEDDEVGDSTSEVGSDDEIEGRAAKRRRLNEEEIMKRREKRLWEENRSKLLFEYSQFTYYAKASAILMFELAWSLNKDDKEMLWLAIVALTEQMLLGKLEDSKYNIEIGSLQAHATRLHNRSNDSEVKTSLKITFEKDLKLVLHKHWCVESSLKFSMFTSCRLKLWTLKGDRKLHQLLAEMGLPLAQSKQKFTSMDLQLRQEFHDSMEKLSEKYNLEDIVYPTFILRYGFTNTYSASDVVYMLLALLETAPKSKSPEECFNTALEFLPKPKKELAEAGIGRAKTLFRVMFKTVQGALEMKQVTSAGPFIYYIIQEGFLDWYMFSNLNVLSLLAQFILKAYVSMSRNRKATQLPLIVSAPKSVDNGTCIILGIPPLCENSPKNFFGKAFEKAAETIRCETTCDFFDTSYFEIPVRDRVRFLDALTAILT
ncbi:cell division control protein 45 homolog [Coccinella septempunctata]|uniref:cell division control protein 45 homolog n=1 Tax=Coccinella septempunctata TaxID=41139 RepID=UPI001D08CC1D|nr:cell division control protein 45 homolog [Coccinella septempunctata]